MQKLKIIWPCKPTTRVPLWAKAVRDPELRLGKVWPALKEQRWSGEPSPWVPSKCAARRGGWWLALNFTAPLWGKREVVPLPHPGEGIPWKNTLGDWGCLLPNWKNLKAGGILGQPAHEGRGCRGQSSCSLHFPLFEGGQQIRIPWAKGCRGRQLHMRDLEGTPPKGFHLDEEVKERSGGVMPGKQGLG